MCWATRQVHAIRCHDDILLLSFHIPEGGSAPCTDDNGSSILIRTLPSCSLRGEYEQGRVTRVSGGHRIKENFACLLLLAYGYHHQPPRNLGSGVKSMLSHSRFGPVWV